MSILQEIAAYKYREVDERKTLFSISSLEKSPLFNRNTLSLMQSLTAEGSSGVIAEFKRRSPSRGIINAASRPEEVCQAYIKAGASAVSVLTDEKFFGGSSEDLMNVRKRIDSPILRKDFIVDEYQIIEARSIGADAVLLIAELHEADRLAQLFDFAGSLELEVLVEVHDEKNISRIPSGTEIVGINSRNLASFEVDLSHSSRIIDLLPKDALKVSESGISSFDDYWNLKNAGFDAFLVGEYFMKTHDPGKTCEKFISVLRHQKNTIR